MCDKARKSYLREGVQEQSKSKVGQAGEKSIKKSCVQAGQKRYEGLVVKKKGKHVSMGIRTRYCLYHAFEGGRQEGKGPASVVTSRARKEKTDVPEKKSPWTRAGSELLDSSRKPAHHRGETRVQRTVAGKKKGSRRGSEPLSTARGR